MLAACLLSLYTANEGVQLACMYDAADIRNRAKRHAHAPCRYVCTYVLNDIDKHAWPMLLSLVTGDGLVMVHQLLDFNKP